MNPASPLFAVLSVGASVVTIGGGVFAWFKIRPEIRKLSAEARKVDVEAAVAEDKAEDEHTAAVTARWRELVAAQTEEIVQPLRAEVGALRGEVATLRAEVEAVRTRYWRAITHVRALLAWIHRHHAQPDGLPLPPVEIAADI
jgi:HAMP domain-containing protein